MQTIFELHYRKFNVYVIARVSGLDGVIKFEIVSVGRKFTHSFAFFLKLVPVPCCVVKIK